MNKKEVLEIRKQFTPANCAITRIAGCYVDHEKNKKMESKSAFLSLPEEEAFKYFDIFKKTLSGTMGKNMLNMEFPIDQEMPGGTQEFLMKLKASKLEDDMLLEEFYDKAKDADYIIYNSTIDGELSTIDELLAKSNLLADFKAVKDGNVWCTGKNLFQETTELGTMIEDIHTILTTDDDSLDELVYMHKLK